MKKILTHLFMLVTALTLLTACGNPLYDDFENFLNTEMVDVNVNYDKIKAEFGAWENLEEDADMEASIQNNLLPLLDDSLAKLAEINPETEEVQALKNQYTEVMEGFQDGLSEMLGAFREQNEAQLEAGTEKIDEALKLLEQYNQGLEDLAKEVGAEIEY